MDIHRIKRFFDTVKHLRFKQIYYRVYYALRNRFFPKTKFKKLRKEPNRLNWQGYEIRFENSFGKEGFHFLNIAHSFKGEIDWNYDAYGKLWTYNLNYFDFLNQKDMDVGTGLGLMEDYLRNDTYLKDGKEPYPISLRGINWIKFLSRNKISNQKIDQTLYRHYQILLANLEYHLLGNHLLENGFSLLFGAVYFDDGELLKKAKQILLEELNEQIMDDGAHFERSPMYHQILLHRVLDCINLIHQNKVMDLDILTFLKKKAEKMCAWLECVTYRNGATPMVNDSAYGIAPETTQLLSYAKSLDLSWKEKPLGESGYRKLITKDFEVFIDVGEVGPNYQPGHAHSDSLSFELHYKNTPVIVDTGISTYEKNQIRQNERATRSHNTVQIGNREQTQVWGGFRVGKRAKIIHLEETPMKIEAAHDGYSPVIHKRKFELTDEVLTIVDQIEPQKGETANAYLHFHPSIENIKVTDKFVTIPVSTKSLTIRFESENLKIEKTSCEIAQGFNHRAPSSKIRVRFTNRLKTSITAF